MYLFFMSTILSFVSVYCHFLGKPVMFWLDRQTSREKSLILQKRDLQKNQSSLSISENFAKFSKLQRQINAFDQELSEIREQRSYKNFKYRFFMQYGLKFVFAVALVVLSLYYRREPVFKLSRKFDLSPLSNVISYPNEENDVSFHFWVACCTTVARLLPFRQ